MLETMGKWESHLVEIVLEMVQVSDIGLGVITKFLELEVLYFGEVSEVY